jgi:hypothetical protein
MSASKQQKFWKHVGISKHYYDPVGAQHHPGTLSGAFDTAGATGFQCLVSPTIAEPCRDTIDGKPDPTQNLLVDAARSVLLQELNLDVVQGIQVREPVAYRAIEQRCSSGGIGAELNVSRILF